MNKTTYLIALSLLAPLTGCSTIGQLSKEMQDVFAKPGESAPAVEIKTAQAPHVPLFAIDSWSITPEHPVSGEKMTSEIRLIAYPGNTDENVQLTVARELQFGKDKIPFGQPKTEVSEAGTISLSWNFTLPVDADPGKYTLATRVTFNDQSETVKNSFKVR